MIKNFFPESELRLYNEDTTKPAFDTNHHRYGWRQHDLQQMIGLLESKADIAIAIDADMKMINPKIRTIIPLVKKFGFCIVASSRYVISHDTEIGADSDKQLDETQGTGYTMCTAFIAIDTANEKVRECITEAIRMIKETPMRLPLILWRAIYKTGVHPYILPQNWCVCEEDLGIGNEIILHIGHQKVKEFYAS